MKNRLCLLGGVLLVGAAVGLLWWSPWETPEPVYRGRPLTTWLKACALAPTSSRLETNLLALAFMRQPSARQVAARLDAEGAIHEAGSNAIPTLLWMLRAEDSPFSSGFV
jgi:hypothetical protein